MYILESSPVLISLGSSIFVALVACDLDPFRIKLLMIFMRLENDGRIFITLSRIFFPEIHQLEIFTQGSSQMNLVTEC